MPAQTDIESEENKDIFYTCKNSDSFLHLAFLRKCPGLGLQQNEKVNKEIPVQMF
jgi:hypothetical protein